MIQGFVKRFLDTGVDVAASATLVNGTDFTCNGVSIPGHAGTPYKLIGILDGVMCKSNCPSGLSNGDNVSVGNDTWLAVIGANSTTSLVKMA